MSKTETITLRVLGYVDQDHQNDENWVAHCLEMDIVAYGDSFQAACRNLLHLIDSQISFALQINDFSSLNHPAPREFFDRWEEAFADQLNRFAQSSSDVQRVSDVRGVVKPKWPTNRLGKFEMQGA